jgi:hypothetical protein
MQTPQENAEGYRRTSAIAHAGELTRPLLIVHGTNDDNVHFANSPASPRRSFAPESRSTLPVAPRT